MALELDLQFDASTAVAHSDAEGIVAISATVTLYAPDGTIVSSPAVTLPTLSTTATGASTVTALTLVSVAGIVRGDLLRITTAGVDYLCEAASINATTKVVQLMARLPEMPVAGDVVQSLKMAATITAPGAARVGGNYRLAWVYTDGTRPRQVGYAVTIVRWPWVMPASLSDVREIVAELGGGTRGEAFCADVIAKVDDLIKSSLLQTGRRASLYLASGLFADVARQGIRFELSRRGICLGGQVYDAQRELRFAFDDSLAHVITGLAAYDTDADGTISASESRPLHFTIRATR